MESMLQIAPKCPKLKLIVSIDKLGESSETRVRGEIEKCNILFMTLEEREIQSSRLFLCLIVIIS